MLNSLPRKLQNGAGRLIAYALPSRILYVVVVHAARRNLQAFIDGLAPVLSYERMIDSASFDIPGAIDGSLCFEQLTGLFSNTCLDHAVISMPVRQAAYVFSLVRQLRPSTAIEIGRYKGGSTLLIAAAMQGCGTLWSLDLGVDESTWYARGFRPFDLQISAFLERYGLKAELLRGDSRTYELPVSDVDLVLIDGDHSYEGVKNDLERFGSKARVGGTVLLDDVFDDGVFPHRTPGVARAVRELLEGGGFRLVHRVSRLAHLERVR